jgi:hypothetical protein
MSKKIVCFRLLVERLKRVNKHIQIQKKSTVLNHNISMSVVFYHLKVNLESFIHREMTGKGKKIIRKLVKPHIFVWEPIEGFNLESRFSNVDSFLAYKLLFYR